MPIAFDEDCPESTEEMLVQFKKAGEEDDYEKELGSLQDYEKWS